MTVYLIETRYKNYTEFHVTVSHERALYEFNTAEERNVDVVVTPYEVEDLVRA
jgi:hypothetical protein